MLYVEKLRNEDFKSMAYMSQENKKQLAPAIKAVLKKYGAKGTISVRNNTNLTVRVKSSKFDFFSKPFIGFDGSEYIRDHSDVNVYHIDKNYSEEQAKFLNELSGAMNVGNHDDSDIQTDYFNVGWYTTIELGSYDKPYIHTIN